MEKLTNELRARQEELAKKYQDKLEDKRKKICALLSKDEENFIYTLNPSDIENKLFDFLKGGKRKPSEYFNTKGKCFFEGFMTKGCILKRHKNAFLYAVDNCTASIFPTGWNRRCFRSQDYTLYIEKIRDIAQDFARLSYIDVDYADYLEDKLPEDLLAYKQKNGSIFNEECYLYAYEIDSNNARVINHVKNALDSGNAAAVNQSMFLGIFMSKNEELYDLTAKLLLAAKLQEGLRQAIAETCDSGRIEAFLKILSVIRDNDLIRYSSIKRAVGCWLGLLTEESRDLERISEKSLAVMTRCLEDENYTKQCLVGSDAMEIYIALWAIACREFKRAEQKTEEIIERGSQHQAVIAGIFLKNVPDEKIRRRLASKAILLRHDEPETMAVYLPQTEYFPTYYSYANGTSKEIKKTLEECFDDRKTAENLYIILSEMLEKMPKSEYIFNPCAFPWNEETLTKSDVVKRLCLIASLLEDADKIDETCTKIPLIKSDSYYGAGRSIQIEMLLSAPCTKTQLDTLVSFACDRETDASEAAFKILKNCLLSASHFAALEEMLKYKAADMRRNIIDLLFKQEKNALYACVSRLISDKKEEKRTAGLDMIIQILEGKHKRLQGKSFEKQYAALTDSIACPTSKEKILIDRIRSLVGNQNSEEGYGLYKETDTYVPKTSSDFIDLCKEEFLRFFPDTRLFDNTPKNEEIDFHLLLSSLDALIEKHKNEEYNDKFAGSTLLGSKLHNFSFIEKEKDGSEHIPFQSLWDDFFTQSIRDKTTCLKLYIYAIGNLEDENFSNEFVRDIFGEKYVDMHTYMHPEKLQYILHYYSETYCPVNNSLHDHRYLKIACALGYHLAYEAKTKELFIATKSNDYMYMFFGDPPAIYTIDGKKFDLTEQHGIKRVFTPFTDKRTNTFLALLTTPSVNFLPQFKDIFSITHRLGERFGFFEKEEKEKRNILYSPFTVSSLLCAADRGIISEGFMYKMLMTKLLDEALSDLSFAIAYLKSGETSSLSRFMSFRNGEEAIKSLLNIAPSANLLGYKLSEEEQKLLDFAAETGKKIIDAVLKTELARGDSPTPFSRHISQIKRIYGAETFVTILSALGKDTLDRSIYIYSSENFSKRQSLSYLLGVCVPEAGDDAKKLKTLLDKTDVSSDKLIEAALFSPAWMDIIEEYLGKRGFKSACYYFIAHTNENFDEKTKAIIAKYTPVSPEELSAGAFDPDWFKEARETLGEEYFEKIYKAAKYISDGAKHSRARKYADAASGKLDRDKTASEITEKRNKDTLMAYALIPLENEADMTERYLFIQNFKKQSQNFGAQRRASEETAAKCALQNLAKNAGFDDADRLTLHVESKIFEEIKPMLGWNKIGDIEIKIEIDENGKAELLAQKEGGILKSIPSKLSKNEEIARFVSVKKQLSQQLKRTRQLFEEAMENQTFFTAKELASLCDNPVISPIVSTLVFKTDEKEKNDGYAKIGFFKNYKLVDCFGEETSLKEEQPLKVAHPYDIYMEGRWHEYQKYLFDHAIVQPFKQVFRELYIKTDEELEAFQSLRYAGNQIQPLKTKACLKTRRWVADVENGLQKIYYKENIIASIYALADWFSPADIEAPTLEWVEFTDRKTSEPIRIADVPNILFSEVMRDVDLAVSVAYAGGVDPETSHSTVEMRKAIIEFSLPLFKLDNVRLEGTHAFITGKRADYSVHLGSGTVHLQGGPMINILPVHSAHRGKLFLPFIDDDPKTSQILSEILLFAEDDKIKDPSILAQIK